MLLADDDDAAASRRRGRGGVIGDALLRCERRMAVARSSEARGTSWRFRFGDAGLGGGGRVPGDSDTRGGL